MSGIYFENQKDGLNRSRSYLDPIANYSFSTKSSYGVTDKDYYVCWNNLPSFGVDDGDSDVINFNSDHLLNSVLGISTIYTAFTENFIGGSLDCMIVRKSDRKAVRIQASNNFDDWSGATYTDVSDIANYPELQRLRLLGII